MKNTLPDRVRLGAFEIDLRAGVVRSGDRTFLLQEKPFRVLLILIEYGGELSTREEIQRKLWPNDTVVDFEAGINTAVKLLRQALGDSADKPKYIETIPRRGYRLLVPIESVNAMQGASSDSSEQGAFLKKDTSGLRVVRHSPDGDLIGKEVSHYLVLEIIGGGGMGLVYEAEDLKLGRHVALKFLPQELANDPIARKRFEREARTASSLSHPNICTIYEIEEHERQPFIVMELLQGETLRERMTAVAEQHTKLASDEVLDIAVQTCNGLQAAHEKGVVHRDIKPANIFLTTTGQVKILDFGLAKHVGTTIETEGEDLQGRHDSAAAMAPTVTLRLDLTLTKLGVAMGTASYMSPEQISGCNLDARTDIFSFGLVLYEMLTGQRAFTGDTATFVHQAILHELPVPARELNTELSSRVEAVIDKALEKDREERYQSAAEMRTALDRLREGNGSPEVVRVRNVGKWVLGIACLLMVAGAALYWRFGNRAKLKLGDTLVVAAFENKTSDAAFDDALKVALESELGQTPFLDVLSPDKVRGALKLMNRQENERLIPALARDVCMHTNSAAVVTGSIIDKGNSYRIELQAANCKTGKRLARASADAKTRSAVVRTLGYAGADLRERLGEPSASLAQFSRPLDEATSPSIEALQAFSQAEKTRMTAGATDALPLYQRAFDLDRNFALAGAYLGIMYGDIGKGNLQSEYLSRAFQLRQRTGQRDRYAIEASYYHLGTGELDKAVSIYKDWLKNYPRDRVALINLANLSDQIGQYAEGEALLTEANRIDPNELITYQDTIDADLGMNRVDDALAVYTAARSHKIDVANLAYEQFEIAFLRNDYAGMAEVAHSSVPEPFYQYLLLTHLALAEEYRGHLRNAGELWRNAADFAGKHNLPVKGGIVGMHAIAQALSGNSNMALKIVEDGVPVRPEETPYPIVLAMALAGDGEHAEVIANEIARKYPMDTLTQDLWVPTILAAVELHKAHPTQAIIQLQRVAPYEDSGSLHLIPTYLRGLAYLHMGHLVEGAGEFQRVLDHPGVSLECQTGPLSRLQLGRAQAMMGDKGSARKSYQDFLNLWKDADPDIPIYKQAKAEYAKLQ